MNYEVSSVNCPQEPNRNQSDDDVVIEEIQTTSNFEFSREVDKNGFPFYYQFSRKGEGSLGIGVNETDKVGWELNKLFERLKQETNEETKDQLLYYLNIFFNILPHEMPYISEESLAETLRSIVNEGAGFTYI